MMRRWATIGVVLLSALSAANAAAQADQGVARNARNHYERGKELYRAHDYPAARAQFKAAYEIDPQPVFLFNWAQAARLSGDCLTAMRLYRSFLRTRPAKSQGEAARQAIVLCRRRLSRARAAEPPAPPSQPAASSQAAPPSSAPSPAPPSRRAWYKDPVGAVLVAAGVAALGVGAGFYRASVASEDAARSALTYDRQQARLDEATSRRRSAVVGLATGGALIVGGALRYFFAGRPERPRVAVDAPGGRGVAITVGGDF